VSSFEAHQSAPSPHVRSAYRRFGKRLVDLTLGTLLAAAVLPVILVLAIPTAVSVRAWPFFFQRRVGFHGRLFWVPKLRTLPPNAPCAADKYAIRSLAIGRFCAFLRKTHLDELPQLLVVPSGRMSLVGPRPELPEILGRYPAEFAAVRAQVRPGCTGLWQISVDSKRLILEAPQYDNYYVRSISFRSDVAILLRTIPACLFERFKTRLDAPTHDRDVCASVDERRSRTRSAEPVMETARRRGG
jgi:lipopolysaccharide/colanic/teichoic acid biosynthesis glycosyltransferase